MKLELRQFATPDEVRMFEKGRFELVHMGDMTIGRASYEPGWKWSMSARTRVNSVVRWSMWG